MICVELYTIVTQSGKNTLSVKSYDQRAKLGWLITPKPNAANWEHPPERKFLAWADVNHYDRIIGRRFLFPGNANHDEDTSQ